MPPKRNHEASDDDVDSQGAKIIRFVSPNSDDVESHEVMVGEDAGEGPKVIQFVSPAVRMEKVLCAIVVVQFSSLQRILQDKRK